MKILEIAIGLSFVYVLFSLICTTLTEAIARVFAIRARTLKGAIRNMIEEDGESDEIPNVLVRIGKWLARIGTWFGGILGSIRTFIMGGSKVTENYTWQGVDALYESSFVRSLARKGKILRMKPGPSYIPPKTFGLALYDTLLEAESNRQAAMVEAIDQALRLTSDPEKQAALEEIVREHVPGGYESPVSKQLLTINSPEALAPALYLESGLDPSSVVPSTMPQTQKQMDAAIDYAQKMDRDDVLNRLRVEVEGIPAGLPIRNELLALLSTEDSTSLTLQTKAKDAFEDFRKAVQAIPSDYSPLRHGLLRILETAEQDANDYSEALAKARIEIEQWFDDTMARVTGWYARNTRTIVIILAFLIAVGFNIDTFAITRALWAEDTIRQSMVENADKFIKPEIQEGDEALESADTWEEDIAAEDDTTTEGDATEENIAADDDAVADGDVTEDDFAAEDDIEAEGEATNEDAADEDGSTASDVTLPIEESEEASGTGEIEAGEEVTYTLDSLLAEVDNLGVPIGWAIIVTETKAVSETAEVSQTAGVLDWVVVKLDRNNEDHQAEILKAERYGQQLPRTPSGWARKVAGLAITWVALSLGAPFWFDLLNMFVNMRAAGKKPEPVDAVDKSISITTNSAG